MTGSLSNTRRKRSGTRAIRAAHAGAPGLPLRSLRHAAWLATLALLLFAFSWQSFVAQTHRHWEPSAAAAGISADSGAAWAKAGRQPPSDQPSDCPICREVAHAGAYLLPPPVALDIPMPAASWRAVAALLSPALVRRTHGWRSRAPPRPIQA